MNVAILIVFTIVIFAALTILRKWRDFFILMAFAIGCGVNAGVYSVLFSQFELSWITLGYDSTLFTVFSFATLIALRDYGKKEAHEMTLAAVVAIAISGTMDFFFNMSNAGGISPEITIKYGTYLLLAIGSYLGNYFMRKIYLFMGEKNIHVLIRFFISGTIGSIVTYVIYFGGYCLISWSLIPDFGSILIGMCLLRLLCFGCACLSFIVNRYVWKPTGIPSNHQKL